MNNFSCVGRMTRDIEIKYSTGEKQMAIGSGSIAIQRKVKAGIGKQEVDFLNFKVFGKTAETLEKFVKKGCQVGLCGEIRADQYTDKTGNNAVYTHLLVNDFTFVGTRESNTTKDDGFRKLQDDLNSEDLPF